MFIPKLQKLEQDARAWTIEFFSVNPSYVHTWEEGEAPLLMDTTSNLIVKTLPVTANKEGLTVERIDTGQPHLYNWDEVGIDIIYIAQCLYSREEVHNG